jgi:hypothetical protein
VTERPPIYSSLGTGVGADKSLAVPSQQKMLKSDARCTWQS